MKLVVSLLVVVVIFAIGILIWNGSYRTDASVNWTCNIELDTEPTTTIKFSRTPEGIELESLSQTQNVSGENGAAGFRRRHIFKTRINVRRRRASASAY